MILKSLILYFGLFGSLSAFSQVTEYPNYYVFGTAMQHKIQCPDPDTLLSRDTIFVEDAMGGNTHQDAWNAVAGEISNVLDGWKSAFEISCNALDENAYAKFAFGVLGVSQERPFPEFKPYGCDNLNPNWQCEAYGFKQGICCKSEVDSDPGPDID